MTISGKRLIGVFVALFLSVATAVPVSAAIYIEFGDFPGEATAGSNNTAGRINLGTASPSLANAPQRNGEIVFTRAHDRMSATLEQWAEDGRTLNGMFLLDIGTTDSDPVKFELERARITSYSFASGGNDGPASTMEHVTLVYDRILRTE